MQELDYIPSEIKELIAGYLLGIIDQEGMKKLSEWIHASEENKQHFNQLNDIWQAAASDKEFDHVDLQKQWMEVISRMRKKQKSTSRKMDTPKSYDTFKRVLKIAAIFIIVFGAGMFVQHFRNPNTGELAAGYVEVKAPIGSRAHVTLSDGTQIWMNAGTRLTYSNLYGKKDRNVNLSGEAYFSVTKQTDLPFMIQTADIKITALGTTFNVKAYEEEGRVETSLESGSVKIERMKPDDNTIDRSEPVIVLHPNEKVSLVTHTTKNRLKEAEKKTEPKEQSTPLDETPPIQESIVEKIDDIRVSTSWKDNNWVIRGESMKSLAVKLSRRYDVHFIFNDKSLEKYKFSTILRDETLEQVLNMIQLSAPIKYTIQGKTVYLGLNPKYEKTFEGSNQ